MLTRLLRPAVLVLACAAAGCAVEAVNGVRTGHFERTFTVDGPVSLDVETRSGDIRIRRGSDKRVRILGRIRANGGMWNSVTDRDIARVEANPPIYQRGNAIDLEQFVSLDPTKGFTIGERRRRTMHGQVRGGGPQVNARARSGSIRVE